MAASSRLTIGVPSVCFSLMDSLYSPLSCSSDVYLTVDDISSRRTRSTRVTSRDSRSRREKRERRNETGENRWEARYDEKDAASAITQRRHDKHLPPRAIARKCCCAASATVLCFDARRRAHVNCGPARPIASRRGVNVSSHESTLRTSISRRVSYSETRKLLTVAQYYHISARAHDRVLPPSNFLDK